MYRKSNRYIVLCAVFSLTVITGCGSHPRSTYPVLEQTVEADNTLDCAGFDNELLKANAIRDAIFEEHGDVIAEVYLGTALDVISEPVSGILFGIMRGASESKAIRAYVEAAEAAGLRMEQMLIYKERDNCASGQTIEPGLTDSNVLMQLRELELQLRQKDISQKQFLAERRAALDSVR